MKYYHSIFKQLHFDYGKMIWSVNHIPFFGSMMSVCDHRNIGSMHSITFYAFLKVLTNGKIKRQQADAIFSLIDMSATGEISFSEIAFFCGILVAQKDHLEREFLYMHAWKIWVTFNETGSDKITTKEFRKAGLFFDFDYPTIYNMYRDYNWDDDIPMDFERFRFYLMSCIHFRTLRRASAKYIRYKKFKVELLEVLCQPLVRVLRDNIYPAPTTILRAIKSIKIAPIEGQERVYHWSDVFTLHWVRSYVHRNVAMLKLEILELMDKSTCFRWFINVFCCGLLCLGREDGDVNKFKQECAKCGACTWNTFCCICSCCACCGLCMIPTKKEGVSSRPLKPVVIRRQLELEMLAEVEKKRHKFKPKEVEYRDEKAAWMNDGNLRRNNRCAIQ